MRELMDSVESAYYCATKDPISGHAPDAARSFGLVLLPWQEALLVYLGIAVLSGVLYRLMWRDMRRPPSTGIEGMMGGIGTVFQLDRGKAKVFYHGEIWDAASKEPITTGEEVEIVGFDDMKLLVRRKV